MNVFLDSNILFEHCFFDSNYLNKILEYANDGYLTLYMSEIVRLELKRQYLREIEAKNKELKKITKDSERLKIDSEVQLLNIDKQLQKFDDFYISLNELSCFNIIPFKNDYLEEIVDRAINRKKPFTEKKTELKDALIWLSYSDYIKNKNLLDCVFLTNNTTDFCDKKDKSKIHNELIKDNDRFTVFNSAHQFIVSRIAPIEAGESHFRNYIQSLNINDEFVFDLLSEKFYSEIEEAITEDVEKLSPNSILRLDYYIGGYVSETAIDIEKCSDVKFEIYKNTAFVSGKASVVCEVNCYEDNFTRHDESDVFSFYSDEHLQYTISFNFEIKQDYSYSNFEVAVVKLWS